MAGSWTALQAELGSPGCGVGSLCAPAILGVPLQPWHSPITPWSAARAPQKPCVTPGVTLCCWAGSSEVADTCSHTENTSGASFQVSPVLRVSWWLLPLLSLLSRGRGAVPCPAADWGKHFPCTHRDPSGSFNPKHTWKWGRCVSSRAVVRMGLSERLCSPSAEDVSGLSIPNLAHPRCCQPCSPGPASISVLHCSFPEPSWDCPAPAGSGWVGKAVLSSRTLPWCSCSTTTPAGAAPSHSIKASALKLSVHWHWLRRALRGQALKPRLEVLFHRCLWQGSRLERRFCAQTLLWGALSGDNERHKAVIAHKCSCWEQDHVVYPHQDLFYTHSPPVYPTVKPHFLGSVLMIFVLLLVVMFANIFP